MLAATRFRTQSPWEMHAPLFEHLDVLGHSLVEPGGQAIKILSRGVIAENVIKEFLGVRAQILGYPLGLFGGRIAQHDVAGLNGVNARRLQLRVIRVRDPIVPGLLAVTKILIPSGLGFGL